MLPCSMSMSEKQAKDKLGAVEQPSWSTLLAVACLQPLGRKAQNSLQLVSSLSLSCSKDAVTTASGIAVANYWEQAFAWICHTAHRLQELS